MFFNVLIGIGLLLSGTLLGAILVTFFPLPIPLADKGHRLFGVKNEQARRALERILSEHGVRRRFAMSFGPTHQVVMKDNQTVLCHFDQGSVPDDEMNAVSLVCKYDTPAGSAQRVAGYLESHGFTATVKIPEGVDGSILCLVKTDALVNSVLAFRKHVLKMPKPEFE